MSKIGIIGDGDIICGFKGLGVSAFPVRDKEGTVSALKKTVDEEFSIVYITEYWAREVLDLIERISTGLFPVVVVIPDNRGDLGLSMERIRKAAIRAIGAEVK